MDADDRPQFKLAIASVAFLANRGAIPPLIVVGIPNGKDRTHDLTPPATGANAKNFPSAGGADAFADFIVDEVLPRVRSRYRTMPTAILAGHSFGGLVALEVAAKRPGVFTGVIAMSSHGLTPAPSLADGLRFVFEPISLATLPISTLGPGTDSAILVNALVESRKRYAEGARAFGMDQRLPEAAVNQMGYGALQFLHKPALAVSIFRRNVSDFPESANTYDSLGDALLAAGDSSGAMAQYRRAIEVGTRTKHPVVEESRRKLKALEEGRAKAKEGKTG